MAASRQTWPIAKPDSCLMATDGRLDLPDLPDPPYHPDAKVVFPKRAFGHKKQVPYFAERNTGSRNGPFFIMAKGRMVCSAALA